MEFNLQPEIGSCDRFMPPDTMEETRAEVVVTPLKIIEEDDPAKYTIVWGCNLWNNCHNVNCWYSVAARNADPKRSKNTSGA